MDQHQRRFVTAAFVAVVDIEAIQLYEARAAVGAGVACLETVERQGAEAQAGEAGGERRRQRQAGCGHAGHLVIVVVEGLSEHAARAAAPNLG
ncbi:hypothetical protein D3C75_1260300 [compost metagenome]